jgi:4-amino-4-deoxy-L-arabinose transferase-like glycosyltransferase
VHGSKGSKGRFDRVRSALRWLGQSPLRCLSATFLLALAIRMIVVLFTYRSLPDADKHYEAFGWEMGWAARALASGRGFSSPYYPWSGPTALEPPLYPFLLSLIFRAFGIYTLTSAFVALSVNSLLSALTCIPVYLSAEYSLGRRYAKYAALAWALYPFAIYFSAARSWEYALTGLLFTTCFCIAQRIHRTANPLAWLGWGALYGLTDHSNASVLSCMPFLLLLALHQVRKRGGRWFLCGVLASIGLLVALTPWTVRNYRTFGAIIPVRDNIWLEIYADNFGNVQQDDSSPPSCDSRPWPPNDPAEMRKYLTMGEAAYMAEKHALSIEDFHQHHQYRFLIVQSLRRAIYYWTGYWSFSAAELKAQPTGPYNMFYVTCMTLLMLLGIRRLWSFNRSGLLPYLVLLCVFPLTYYLTNTPMDYRQPIEPAVVVLAVAGFIALRRKEGFFAAAPTAEFRAEVHQLA